MSKKSLGFLLGFFFGILGLFGLLACDNQEAKDSFMSGWWKAFIINIVLVVILFSITTCATCAFVNSLYYY